MIKCNAFYLKEEKIKHECSRISQTFGSNRPQEFCWKAILKKNCKIHKKASFVKSFFSPVKLLA